MILNDLTMSTTEADSSFKDQELKIEFDGTTVLCRVCGDKASGFHYGVHSCEGCKGFFRRSIQQKIQYRPCTKNQQCSILRINRNRCQYCRLKKCIAVGMSRDAVRFGRVPKREKAKILAAMQKMNQNSQEKHLNEQLEDENRLLVSIIQAHEETCDYTREKVAPLIEKARKSPVYAKCPLQMACPLNPLPPNGENGEANGILEDFSERFSPAIRGVVEFAKRIPGFGMLSQDDQVTLLKAGVFEVLLVRLACLFDKQANSMICLNGMVLKRESLHSQSSARFLLGSMFEFAERLNGLNLSDHEIALFCAVVVISPDRPGIRNTDLVQKIHRKLDDLLEKAIIAHHSDNVGLFAELKKKIPDLRTLNTLHSEKLLAFKMGPQNDGLGRSRSDSPLCSYASLLPGQWSSLSLNDPVGSPSGSADWSDSKESEFGSTRSYVTSSDYGCTRSCSTGSTKRVDGRFSPENGYLLAKRLLAPEKECEYYREKKDKVRRVDSPTDSGIESGKELGSATPANSVCSSPRSGMDDKVKELDEGEKEGIDDMPMLKRALQAPPLVNSNMLMDEAYRHHKKFRVGKRDVEMPSSTASNCVMSPGGISSIGPMSNANSSVSDAGLESGIESVVLGGPKSCRDGERRGSLGSTHSTLVKVLEEAPVYRCMEVSGNDVNNVMPPPLDLSRKRDLLFM